MSPRRRMSRREFVDFPSPGESLTLHSSSRRWGSKKRPTRLGPIIQVKKTPEGPSFRELLEDMYARLEKIEIRTREPSVSSVVSEAAIDLDISERERLQPEKEEMDSLSPLDIQQVLPRSEERREVQELPPTMVLEKPAGSPEGDTELSPDVEMDSLLQKLEDIRRSQEKLLRGELDRIEGLIGSVDDLVLNLEAANQERKREEMT